MPETARNPGFHWLGGHWQLSLVIERELIRIGISLGEPTKRGLAGESMIAKFNY